MDEIWAKLYAAAKAVQQERQISDYVLAGGVAAAVLSKSGRIYTGVCIDTCSTLGICAERNAIFNMITNGEQEIDKVLCILPDGSGGTPCGACREQGEVREIFANPKTAAARRLVAPNGGSAARDLSSFAPDDHVVRVTFNGSSAAKPLVASLAAEKGILVSVLSADTRDLSGQCYGSMLLKLPRDTEQAKQAAAYMRSQNGVTVEEVTGE